MTRRPLRSVPTGAPVLRLVHGTPAGEQAVPDAVVIRSVNTGCGRDRSRVLAIICPHCGRKHTHGGGPVSEPVEDYLGHRASHCGSRYNPRTDRWEMPPGHNLGYYLVMPAPGGAA